MTMAHDPYAPKRNPAGTFRETGTEKLFQNSEEVFGRGAVAIMREHSQTMQASFDGLNDAIDRLIEQKRAAVAVLQEVENYLDERADADDGIPNDAMRLLIEVRAVIARQS